MLDNGEVEAAEASVAEVVRYALDGYPSCARRAGLHEYDARLPRVGPRPADELVRLRLAATGQRDALSSSAHAELRADLDAAVKLIDAELFEINDLDTPAMNPLDVIAETDINSYLDSSYAPWRERADRVTAHLAALPDFLSQAEAELPERLAAGGRMRAVEQAMLQSARIRATIGELAADEPNPALVCAAESAAAACEAYARALDACRPTGRVLGHERLAAQLYSSEGIERGIHDLVDEVADEVAELVAVIEAATRRLGESDVRQAYARLGTEISHESVLVSTRAAIERVERFWRERDLVSVDVTHPMEVSVFPSGASTAKIVFDVGAPLELDRQPYVLRMPDPRGDNVLCREYLNDPTLEILAVHETFVGHYLHTEVALRQPGLMRTCLRWTAGFPEGWSHYAEELAVAHGLAEGRPLVALAQLRLALEASVRCLIYLSVHTCRWTFGEAVAQASALCHWVPDRAVREVLLGTSHESTAMYTIGKLTIRDWRRAAGGDPKPFHDRILRCGYAPLSTVWNYFRDGQQPERNAAPEKESIWSTSI